MTLREATMSSWITDYGCLCDMLAMRQELYGRTRELVRSVEPERAKELRAAARLLTVQCRRAVDAI